MRQGQRQEPIITQRQKLGLAARQAQELLTLPLPELAGLLERRAAENPFLACRPPAPPRIPAAGGPESPGPSLFAHVLAEIPLLVAEPADRAIAMRLAEALAETGLLAEDPRAVATELSLPVARVEAVLGRLQAIEPAGLFARSATECLALQLRACDELDETAVTLLCHLEGLRTDGVAGFARRHGLDAGRVRVLLTRIGRLGRSPAAAFDTGVAPAVWPDLAFHRGRSGWTATLSAGSAPLVVLRPAAFERALARAADTAARSLARRQWAEAQALGRLLNRRDDTLRHLGAILARDQRQGLDSAWRNLAPLTQREVAAKLQVHPSTVSRLVRHRMALVEGRMVPIARFFERARRGEAPPGQTRSAILSALHRWVAEEPGARPFSDADLARLLSEPGTRVSRRRVAKYRALLNIPCASVRLARARLLRPGG